MSYDIGPRIGIEGEKEYKQALAEISSGQKVLASELALVAEKFSGQENSIEGLTAKHDVLQRTLYTERDKVEELRKALNNAANSFGESDKRTMEWQTKLNKAEAELIRTEKAVKDTEEQIRSLSDAEQKGGEEQDKYNKKVGETGDKLTGVGDLLDGLCKKLGISLPKNAKASLNSFAKIDAASIAAVSGIAAVIAVIAKLEGELIKMTKEQAAAADEILTLSTVSGISTEKLQEYAYASELLDTSVETITSSHTKLIKSMEAAERGTETQAEAFAALQISVTDANGELRDNEEVFWEVIDALGKVENETERDKLAMDLMGKSAQDLNPLIAAGADEFKKLGKEAKETGYILDEKTLKALGAVDDSMQEFSNATETAKKKLSAEFAPYLKEFYEKVTEAVENGAEVLDQSGIVDALGGILTSVSGLLDPISELNDDELPSLAKALRPIAVLFATIADTVSLIGGILTEDWDKIDTALGFKPGSNLDKLYKEWNAYDTNAATDKNGYGGYYYNGNFYGTKNAAAQAGYQEYVENFRKQVTESGDVNLSGWDKTHGDVKLLSFEEWKSKNHFNSSGNENFAGGVTWVGENGPERVYLPAGTRIDNAQESRQDGDNIFYVTIDAKNVKEFNDIVQLAKTAKMRERKRGDKK